MFSDRMRAGPDSDEQSSNSEDSKARCGEFLSGIEENELEKHDFEEVTKCLGLAYADKAIIPGAYELRPREYQHALDFVASRYARYRALVVEAKTPGSASLRLLERTGLLREADYLHCHLTDSKKNAVRLITKAALRPLM